MGTLEYGVLTIALKDWGIKEVYCSVYNSFWIASWDSPIDEMEWIDPWRDKIEQVFRGAINQSERTIIEVHPENPLHNEGTSGFKPDRTMKTEED